MKELVGKVCRWKDEFRAIGRGMVYSKPFDYSSHCQEQEIDLVEDNYQTFVVLQVEALSMIEDEEQWYSARLLFADGVCLWLNFAGKRIEEVTTP